MSGGLEWSIDDVKNWWARPLPVTAYSAGDAECCGARRNGSRWICTRPPSHGGRHVAATSMREVVAVWRQA